MSTCHFQPGFLKMLYTGVGFGIQEIVWIVLMSMKKVNGCMKLATHACVISANIASFSRIVLTACIAMTVADVMNVLCLRICVTKAMFLKMNNFLVKNI